MLENKYSLSIILPCYNEEAILATNVESIIKYLSNTSKYQYEIIIVNDGSKDNTGKIANDLEKKHAQIRVIHHPTNLNLGRALQTGFQNSRNDILVVLDIDLSYSVDHIELLVDKLIETSADLVVASPYMKEGKVTAVPFTRKIMSKWVNVFMRVFATSDLHTFTGMVRAYKREFIQNLDLKTVDYEINPEIIYKGIILRAKMIEIPAHLDWTEQLKHKATRQSSLKIVKGFFSGLMSTFIFRPYFFFLGIGAILMILSLYELVWLLYDTLYDLNQTYLSGVGASFSLSLAKQFSKNPQSFLVGGITFVSAIQFLSLGFLSLQSKRYFEEIYHLGTAIKKQTFCSKND